MHRLARSGDGQNPSFRFNEAHWWGRGWWSKKKITDYTNSKGNNIRSLNVNTSPLLFCCASDEIEETVNDCSSEWLGEETKKITDASHFLSRASVKDLFSLHGVCRPLVAPLLMCSILLSIQWLCWLFYGGVDLVKCCNLCCILVLSSSYNQTISQISSSMAELSQL